MNSRLLQRAAAQIASSFLLRRGQHLWQKNQADWNLPLSKWEKLWTGLYLVLRDYSQGMFPPTFPDQQQAYLNEINSRFSSPGLSPGQVTLAELRKPFWFGHSLHSYVGGFLKLASALEKVGVRPPARLLELGGGSGWMAEFLAQLGFAVVCTTISPYDVEAGHKRIESLGAKGISCDLRILPAPMESVAEHVKELCPFDAVFVFEALHHAFDWKSAIGSAYQCLSDGGWLFLCNEPNVLHTAISYRVAKLSNTHEIGFSRRQ